MGRIEIGIKEREAYLFASYLLILEEKTKSNLKRGLAKRIFKPYFCLNLGIQVSKELVRKRFDNERVKIKALK